MSHTAVEATLSDTPSGQSLIKQYWLKLAYHHRLAESTLYLLFATGLPLWNIFSLPWVGERTLLFVHVLAGLILFPLAVVPFWLSHRRLLGTANGNPRHNPRKKKLRKTGQVIEILLLLSTLSGVYLLLLGNRGEWLGWVNHYTHLITAIPIALLLFVHALRWSVLRSLFGPLFSLFSTSSKSLFNKSN
ncbi:hypothetical protein [Motiliproteus coralliicola]|uniref:hypothetical protein n=1 Tax=Motiliproteus coralliicola TaxID=2283196 RepID=UPI001A9D78F8|nr:hypothetical protein [Motiliproteus coralliicola]